MTIGSVSCDAVKFGITSIFFLLDKKIIYNWGKLRVFYNGKSLKVIIEIFNSIKEIKIFRKYSSWAQEFGCLEQ